MCFLTVISIFKQSVEKAKPKVTHCQHNTGPNAKLILPPTLAPSLVKSRLPFDELVLIAFRMKAYRQLKTLRVESVM